LKRASSPPWSYGQRLELAESTLPRGLAFHCTVETGDIYTAPLNIYRVLHLLLRQRRGAAGSGLGTTMKYLRRTTSRAEGSYLATTVKYLRQATCGAAGNGLGVTI
jgi:hypothetical protein